MAPITFVVYSVDIIEFGRGQTAPGLLCLPRLPFLVQITAVFGIAQPDAVQHIGRIPAVEQVIRGGGTFLARLGKTVPEIECQPAQPLAAAGLPSLVQALHADGPLLVVKQAVNVLPRVGIEAQHIEQGLMLAVRTSAFVELLKKEVFVGVTGKMKVAHVYMSFPLRFYRSSDMSFSLQTAPVYC